jgi:hypothetical protein
VAFRQNLKCYARRMPEDSSRALEKAEWSAVHLSQQAAIPGPVRPDAVLAVLRLSVVRSRLSSLDTRLDNPLGHARCASAPRCPSVRALRPSLRPQPRVRTFCTFSGRPIGPLAPPPRRPGRHSRCRSRDGRANAGRLARKAQKRRAAIDVQAFNGIRAPGGGPCSRRGIVRGRAEPVKSAYGVGFADLRLLTEPARPGMWQRSEAWTRVARTVDA